MSASEEQDPMAQHFVECKLCETRPAQHFCNTCPRTLCEICKEEHKRRKIYQNHEIITLSSRKQTTAFCTDHRTKRCDLYCKQCNQPACSECIIEKHKDHTIDKLSSYLKEQREMLMQYIHRTNKTVIPAYENLVTEMKTSHEQVINSCSAEASTVIQKQTENIIRAVKSAEAGILGVLKKNKQRALVSIESDLSVVSKRIIRLNEIKKTLQEMHDSNSVDEKSLKQQIANIEELETLPKVTTATPFKFVPGNLETAQIRRQICNLTSLGLCKIQKSRLNKSSDPARFVRSDKKLMKKPIRKTEVKVDVEIQHQIRCMNTNTAVVRGNDNKIRIVDISGQVTTITTSLPQGRWPGGMDLTKDNDIIYTDRRKRKVMRVSMDGDISTLFTLTDYFPTCLSVTRSGSIVISLLLKLNHDDEGQRGKVVEYTTSGQIVKEFNKDGGRELFKRPIRVVKNPVNDDIIVSDYVLDKVIVLNGMGDLKFEYNGKALSKSDKFSPCQITCDSLCQILIADLYSSAIHVISQDGHPRALLLASELKKPVGVHFDGINSVWIAEAKSKKLKIYKYLE